MKIRKSICGFFVLVMLLGTQLALAQKLSGYTFRIVDMMPNSQSNETNNDAETNIAVNPANTSVIAGSAFTFNPKLTTATAPIYISTNGGTTWSLNSIVPSGSGTTSDISLSFAGTSGNLYTGILRGGSFFRLMMLRTGTPAAGTTMTTLADRSTVTVDQPFISATTVNDASSIPRDRVFSGDNLVGSSIFSGGNGRTAEVMFSNDAGAAAAAFTNQILEVRNPITQDMPATRMAIHSSGVVYGAFYSWTSGGSTAARCDVVVVRDDNFATGATPFSALVDANDNIAGQRVVTNQLVPAFGGTTLGTNRLVASNLAIAVDPNNSANVFLAWCDRVATTDYTLHLRRSTNSGQGWGTADWLTITNATNPGIAVTTDGKVGVIYQQFTGTGATATWETHFRFSTLGGTSFTDDILSTFLDSDLTIDTGVFGNFLGDYLDIQSVGTSFYGVFPAGNRPVSTNFPHSVSYQRNADFTTQQLLDSTKTSNIAVSIDPFFFKVSPLLLNICAIHPEICSWVYVHLRVLRFPPYPCIRCPWPCLQCPPFELPFEDVYKQVFSDSQPKTILTVPYFHLYLDGYDVRDFDVVITQAGEPINQELNKTEKGYAISFHASKTNYNPKQGVHGLKIRATPKNAAAAKKGAEFTFRLEASDYRFNEHSAMSHQK